MILKSLTCDHRNRTERKYPELVSKIFCQLNYRESNFTIEIKYVDRHVNEFPRSSIRLFTLASCRLFFQLLI